MPAVVEPGLPGSDLRRSSGQAAPYKRIAVRHFVK